MKMEELVEIYIESRKESWSDTTFKNERYRLRGVTIAMLHDPKALWDYLTKDRKLKPYSAKIAFVRAGEVLEYAIREGLMKRGPNVIKDWMRDHENKFKNSYVKKEVELTYDEALSRIHRIERDDIREKALQLMGTGMRYKESTTLTKSGRVVGKGGLVRDVPGGKEMQNDFGLSYHTFLRHLKLIGLTPHMLRKLAATKAKEMGASDADMMKAFGWKTNSMLAQYEQAHRQKELADNLLSALKIKKGKYAK